MRRRAGWTPFPRHGVLRVSDLLPPAVPPDRVRAALAARGVPEADRDVPAGPAVRALVSETAAGTVVTFERRGSALATRRRVLRDLAREWDLLVADVEDGARSAEETGQKRTSHPFSGA